MQFYSHSVKVSFKKYIFLGRQSCCNLNIVSQISPHVVTTAAGTWEAVPAQALVNTMATVAMTTAVSAKSNKSTVLTTSAVLSCFEQSVCQFQCNAVPRMKHTFVPFFVFV